MSWLSSTSIWLKKQYFNGTHYIDVLSQGRLSGEVSLFGITFSNTGSEKDKQEGLQSQQCANIVYKSVLWFTYRQGIKFRNNQEMTSDVGWGCMIRVGQMMLAQVFRIHAGQHLYADEEFLRRLIDEFLNPEGSFSIETLVEIGKEELDKEVGDWYSPSDIGVVLQKAVSSHTCKLLSKQIKVVIYSGDFSLKKTFNKLRVSGNSARMVPSLMIIQVRIGFEKPEKQFLESILNIIRKEPRFVGILGGRASKAHYIFGATPKQFIYLDPHCVKNQTSIENLLCEIVFSMPHQKLDPSMGLCFYFKDVEELTRLHERLRAMGKNSPIFCHEHQNMEILELEDEQFEILQ